MKQIRLPPEISKAYIEAMFEMFENEETEEVNRILQG